MTIEDFKLLSLFLNCPNFFYFNVKCIAKDNKRIDRRFYSKKRY